MEAPKSDSVRKAPPEAPGASRMNELPDELGDEFDPDEELEPGVRLRPAGQAAFSVDPELRADDESPLERNRVLRPRKA